MSTDTAACLLEFLFSFLGRLLPNIVCDAIPSWSYSENKYYSWPVFHEFPCILLQSRKQREDNGKHAKIGAVLHRNRGNCRVACPTLFEFSDDNFRHSGNGWRSRLLKKFPRENSRLVRYFKRDGANVSHSTFVDCKQHNNDHSY